MNVAYSMSVTSGQLVLKMDHIKKMNEAAQIKNIIENSYWQAVCI